MMISSVLSEHYNISWRANQEMLTRQGCITENEDTDKFWWLAQNVWSFFQTQLFIARLCESFFQKVLNTFESTLMDVYHAALDLEIIHKDTLLKEGALLLPLTTQGSYLS
jgi:hypothetical protein